MGLIRKLFWVILFLVATFCFVVLFEHGPNNFRAGAKKEFESLRGALQPMDKKEDKSDNVVP